MNTAVQLFDHKGRAIALRDVSALEATVFQQSEHMHFMQERLAELELAMEDQGWRQLIVGGQREFSRAGLGEIMRMSRLMYLKNPLIKRGVNIQAHYVWGRGVSITARDKRVNRVVQAFLDDPKNRAELTSHQARTAKEIDLQVLGNVFLVFFSDNVDTGTVRVRSIPPDDIRSIIANPEDAKDPWFYKREWTEYVVDESNGAQTERARIAYYPDWNHRPSSRPAKMYGQDVMWDSPVFHLKVGGLSDMSMGIPETYAAIDWARAYKEFLEDWCTITRAYARFAWDLKTTGGTRGVQAAKTKLATTLATGANETTIETNPSPTVGATYIRPDSVELKPFKTAGATTSAEDGRRVLLMVAAAIGLPETFFGDANVGNHATSKTLDRPTELKFLDRQTLWAEALRMVLDFVIDRAAEATNGPLAGMQLINMQAADLGDEDVPLRSDPQSGEEVDRFVAVDFPTLLEHDVVQQVEAIVNAATLGGYELAGTIDLQTVSRMLLSELGAQDVDEIIKKLFPEGQGIISGRPLTDDERLDRQQSQPVPPEQNDPYDRPGPFLDDDLARSATATEAAFRGRAARELRRTLQQFAEKYAGQRLAKAA